MKGVGEAAVQDIVECRQRDGKFKSVYDFMERVNLQAVNRKTLENLAVGGALRRYQRPAPQRLFCIGRPRRNLS
ncbi:MAG: hypothetical protein ACLR8Y_18285 [Alistipes indistinctus]